MPQFSYDAQDSSGRPVRGVLDAASENDLIIRLSGQGLRVQSITRGTFAPVTPAPPRTVQAAQPLIQRPVQVLPATARPVGQQVVRTRRAKYSELHFLFTQLANLLRSGINPAAALNELAQRQMKPHMRSALQHMATLTTEGRSLADAAALYPDIFPPGAVGALQSGQAGGYLWQSCESLSEQYKQANDIARATRLFRWVAVPGLFAIPITVMMTKALDKSFADLSGLPGYILGLGQQLVGPWGFVMLAMAIAYWTAAWWGRRTEQRRLRHNFGTKIPLFSRRARAESLAAFNWHLSKLSEAGVAPSTAWNYAASALPNEEYASRMGQIGQQVRDKSRLGELVRQSGIYPPDYIGLIETGEMAGNLPGALDQASRLAAEDFNFASKASKMSLYGAYLFMFMIITVVCVATFNIGYFNSVYNHTVGETEQE